MTTIHMVHNVGMAEISNLADAIATTIQDALTEDHDGCWDPDLDERNDLLELIFEELKKPEHWED